MLRFVERLDADAYLRWRKSIQEKDSLQKTSTELKEQHQENTNEPRRSFQEICELIVAGKPISGIRHIPNKLNEGSLSQPSMSPRPKPWERERGATIPPSISTE